MPPTLSVIIPTYNRAELIRSCLGSLLALNLAETELIVVDDGSTDGTAAVVRDFKSHVDYVRQENTGPAGARNTGVARSRGRYLAFLDSDDSWAPGAPERLVSILDRHPDVPVVFADARMGSPSYGFKSFVEEYGGRDFEALLRGEIEPDVVWLDRRLFFRRLIVRNVVFPGSLFWRREVFEDLGGFDPALYVAEDWELFIRLAARYDVAYCRGLQATLYNWHDAGDRLTTDPERMALGFAAALESVLRKNVGSSEDRAHLEHVLSRHLAALAYLAYDAGDLALARRRYAAWLSRFRFDERIFALWLASHAPREVLRWLRLGKQMVVARL